MAHQIVSRDVEVTDQVERDILEKVGKIDKFLTRFPDDTFFLRISLSRNQTNPDWTDALIDLALPGDVFIGQGSASTTEHAVHLATIHLERQLEEHKERVYPYPPPRRPT